MRELSAVELHARLAEGLDKPLLLDVREKIEYDYCHISGSVHIPLNDLPARAAELDAAQDIVLICHHGIRSRMAGEFLESLHFKRLLNLTGGVHQWALTVDHNMPRY